MTQQNSRRDERALQRRLAELERRIKVLETAPRAGNTSVSNGKFMIQDGGGGAQLLRVGYLGQDAVSGADVRGSSIRRPTGEYAFATWSGASGDDGGFWAWYDKAGNTVFSDDAVSGQGLANPFLGAPIFAPIDSSKWPSVTSSSYVTQWVARWCKQNPRLLMRVWTRTDAGTSGDVRVTCNGVSVTQAVPGGDNAERELILTVPGAHTAMLEIDIDMRRTGGTGFMGCWPMACYGIAS